MFSAPVLWTFGPKLKWWWQKVRRSSKVLPFSMFGTKFQDSQSTKTTQWRHWKPLKSVGFSFLWNTDAFAACMPDVKSPAASFYLPRRSKWRRFTTRSHFRLCSRSWSLTRYMKSGMMHKMKMWVPLHNVHSNIWLKGLWSEEVNGIPSHRSDKRGRSV